MISHDELCRKLDEFFAGRVDSKPVYEALGLDVSDYNELEVHVNYQAAWLQAYTANAMTLFLKQITKRNRAGADSGKG